MKLLLTSAGIKNTSIHDALVDLLGKPIAECYGSPQGTWRFISGQSAHGDALYLSHWMRQSGLANLVPSLSETVYVGFSAGSMVLTPRIGEDFVGWKPPTGDDGTLGIVDFSIFPHVDHPDLPDNTMAEAERWAAGLAGPAYAIDDETAIRVVEDTVDVVSEGHWKRFPPAHREAREVTPGPAAPNRIDGEAS
jgi:dipeptidase E